MTIILSSLNLQILGPRSS